ncbi:TetR family transcriptional regulator [Cohnella kolymensis]|uniref:TetR family transcriptional regulator n=1 Tax=Cohnella kolymensis TaxID=1590652 RepID=A0ABR5A686_9BACL|nr:TetR family transcriptional regulator [Cohnella kolymensis]
MSAERKPVDRRKQVIEAAKRSFASFGYKATTMEQVAKLAGVGKGTIYTFFSNKEQLFDEIMSGMIHDMREIAEETLNSSLPFAETLTGVLSRLLDYRDRHQLAVKLSQEVRDIGTAVAKEGLDQLEGAIVAFIARHVKVYVDRGEVKPCDPDLTAYLMLKTYLALTVDGPYLRQPLGKEEVLKHFRFYWMEGLAVR